MTPGNFKLNFILQTSKFKAAQLSTVNVYIVKITAVSSLLDKLVPNGNDVSPVISSPNATQSLTRRYAILLMLNFQYDGRDLGFELDCHRLRWYTMRNISRVSLQKISLNAISHILSPMPNCNF